MGATPPLYGETGNPAPGNSAPGVELACPVFLDRTFQGWPNLPCAAVCILRRVCLSGVKFWRAFSQMSAPAFLLVFFYVAFQWFLQATDVTIHYNWTQDRRGFHPDFNIRNRSRSKTYFLASIEYRKGDGPAPLDVDNKSVWGRELKPGSIDFSAGYRPGETHRLVTRMY